MSKAMLLSAILLLCFIPFTIVAASLTGRSDVTALDRHLGLNQQAANDVSRLFAPAHTTSSALSGASYVLFVLGGIAAAAAIQELYEKLFDLEGRGMKNVPLQILWLVTIFVMTGIAALLSPHVLHLGGPVLLALVGVVLQTIFWWFSIWLLLAWREPWRPLFPCALATAIGWVGMYAVFHLVFSTSIIQDSKKYGEIGVIFALMSFFIAIGVVIILGGVFGLVWREARSASTPSHDVPVVDTNPGSSN